VETVVAHEPRVSAGEFSILRQAALDGLGIGFMAEYACRDPLEDGRLERVLPAWGGRETIFHLLFTSRRGLLPSVRAVIDFAAAALDPRSQGWRNAA
jgi:DNA-binding transcriptional LysR family regulator